MGLLLLLLFAQVTKRSIMSMLNHGFMVYLCFFVFVTSLDNTTLLLEKKMMMGASNKVTR